jgi:hypothetical protein
VIDFIIGSSVALSKKCSLSNALTMRRGQSKVSGDPHEFVRFGYGDEHRTGDQLKVGAVEKLGGDGTPEYNPPHGNRPDPPVERLDAGNVGDALERFVVNQ